MVVVGGTDIFAPVIYTPAHQTRAGEVPFISGIVSINSTSPYALTFTPVDIPYYSIEGFLNTMILDGDYLNIVFPFNDFPNTAGATIIRFNPATNTAVSFFVPIAITGGAVRTTNNYAFTSSDGTFLLLQNPVTGNYSNFTYATVDFTDYGT